MILLFQFNTTECIRLVCFMWSCNSTGIWLTISDEGGPSSQKVEILWIVYMHFMNSTRISGSTCSVLGFPLFYTDIRTALLYIYMMMMIYVFWIVARYITDILQSASNYDINFQRDDKHIFLRCGIVSNGLPKIQQLKLQQFLPWKAEFVD